MSAVSALIWVGLIVLLAASFALGWKLRGWMTKPTPQITQGTEVKAAADFFSDLNKRAAALKRKAVLFFWVALAPSLAAFVLVGWVLNIWAIYKADSLWPLTGQIGLRLAGLFVVPLGTVMGFL